MKRNLLALAAVLLAVAAFAFVNRPASAPIITETPEMQTDLSPLFDATTLSGFQPAGPVMSIEGYKSYSHGWSVNPNVGLSLMVRHPGFQMHDYQAQFPVEHSTQDVLGVPVEFGFQDDYSLNGVAVTYRYQRLAFDFEYGGSLFIGEFSFLAGTTDAFDPALLNQALVDLVSAVTGQPVTAATTPDAQPAAFVQPGISRPDNCATAVAAGLSAQQAAQWEHLDRDNDGDRKSVV